MERIDAHQHYWRTDRGDYGWLTPDTGILYNNYGPEQLRPLLAENGVSRTIVVQAAPTVAESEYLLSLCDEDDSIAGVVGWVDIDSDRFAEDLEQLRRHPKFVGIRPMIQDLAADYMLKPEVLRSLAVLEELQFPIDLLIRPQHLPYAVQALERVPRLRAVVDHLAKPHIAAGTIEPWAEDLAKLARFEQVYCKLSGMVTEAEHGNWRLEQFVPYVHHAVSIFGTERLMFGSDWPVCLLSAEYGETVRLLHEALPAGLTEEQLGGIFGGNALRFYGI